MPKLLISALFLIGCGVCLQASWLPAKAWLSQQLIQYSWQQSIASKNAIKPWPWADTYPIGELSFERLQKKIVVLNGGDPTTLAFSAGAVAPFNQVNGDQPFVVAGHRDSHFSFLKEVVMSDVISLTDKYGRIQLYQVENIEIVDASIGELPLKADEKNLVFITCYPFVAIAANSNERYIITAKLL